MTRDEFLADPLGHFRSDPSNLPGEWIRTAWETDDTFNGEIFYEMRDEIGKSGTLKGLLPLMRRITSALSPDQVVELFVDLGGGGHNPREPEWRHDFESCVPQYVHLLPPIPPDILRIRYAEYLALSIQYDRGEWVPELLADYQARGGDVTRLGKVAALTPTSELEEYEVIPARNPEVTRYFKLRRG